MSYPQKRANHESYSVLKDSNKPHLQTASKAKQVLEKKEENAVFHKLGLCLLLPLI